jgi:hypothetical protein
LVYMNWVNRYELRFGSGSKLIGSNSCLTGQIELHEMGVCPLRWSGLSATRWEGIKLVYTNWVNRYELRFRSGSRLIGSDSCLTGQIELREMGVCPLGWSGLSATRWAASRAARERG